MKKPFILFTIVVLVSFQILGQTRSFSKNVNIGISTPILDNGVGIHVGLNPHFAINQVIGLEGQLSYVHTTINGSFINGAVGYENSFNLLIGGRLYPLPKARRCKPYFNLLLGGLHNRYYLDSYESQRSEETVGFSSGLFLERKRMVIGVSYDTPSNLILKIGLKF